MFSMRKTTIEEYVETIYEIQNQKKKDHTNDVASPLNKKPASVTEIRNISVENIELVTEMFNKLTDEGYIFYEKYNGVILTDKGKNIAIMLKKRHETLRYFLELLGVDKEIANNDACRIEHNVNPQTVKKLRKFIEYAKRENACSRWLDHFKYFDETGKFIICSPKKEFNCPIHKNDK